MVIRKGRPARPLQASGAALNDVFRRRHDPAGVDDDFAANVSAAREAGAAESDGDPWRD